MLLFDLGSLIMTADLMPKSLVRNYLSKSKDSYLKPSKLSQSIYTIAKSCEGVEPPELTIVSTSNIQLRSRCLCLSFFIKASSQSQFLSQLPRTRGECVLEAISTADQGITPDTTD